MKKNILFLMAALSWAALSAKSIVLYNFSGNNVGIIKQGYLIGLADGGKTIIQHVDTPYTLEYMPDVRLSNLTSTVLPGQGTYYIRKDKEELVFTSLKEATALGLCGL